MTKYDNTHLTISLIYFLSHLKYKLLDLTLKPCSVPSPTHFTAEIATPGSSPVFQPLTYCLFKQVSSCSPSIAHVWEGFPRKQESYFLILLIPFLSSLFPHHLLWQCTSCCYFKATKLNYIAPLYSLINEYNTNAQSYSWVSPMMQATAFLWIHSYLKTSTFKKANKNTQTHNSYKNSLCWEKVSFRKKKKGGVWATSP